MEHKKLIVAQTLLLFVIATGTAGYYYFEKMEVFDAFYMTLITISTVGFGEIKPLHPAGRLLTIFIIVSGISLLTYSLSQIATIFIEGELRKILGRKKMERQLTKLQDHFIICGYGRIGETIAKELLHNNHPLVVIEQDEEIIEQLDASGIIYLAMDATREEALLEAGLLRAKGLVTAVSSDANNVFIALTARGVNPDIFILARALDPGNENKLIRAGANKVVSPYVIGGKRMAEILQRPTVVDFIDQAMMNTELGLRMEEVSIGPRSSLVGKSLIDSKLRVSFGVIVIAIKPVVGDMIFNPNADQVLSAGDVLVIIGKRNDLLRLNKIL